MRNSEPVPLPTFLRAGHLDEGKRVDNSRVKDTAKNLTRRKDDGYVVTQLSIVETLHCGYDRRLIADFDYDHRVVKVGCWQK